MPELDGFDIRLEAAVRAFADRAETRVDAAAMAERAIGRRRTGVWAVLDHSVPVPVPLLLLVALLLGVLIASLGVGAPLDRGFGIVPVPSTSPTPHAAPSPTPSPLRPTDGQGDEVVDGTETVVIVTEPTRQVVSSVTRTRGGLATVAAAMNDPRVTGTGTWRFDRDDHATVGTEWGTYHLENDGGAWDGTCSGGTWNAAEGAVRTCWLTGTGAYAGDSYYFAMTQTSPGSGAVEGVIYPGAPAGP